MAKRFTCSDKWRKKWFRKLVPVEKCFWVYVTDNCSRAGIWEVDFELAEMFIGKKLDKEKIKQTFSKQYVELDGGRRWFIKDFLGFQYGELKLDYNPHKDIIRELNKFNLQKYVGNPRVKQPLGKGSSTLQDKDKDKDKDNKGVYGEDDKVKLTDKQYKKLCKKLGKRTVQDYIDRLNDYICQKGKKYKSHYHTILAWARKDGVYGNKKDKFKGDIRWD